MVSVAPVVLHVIRPVKGGMKTHLIQLLEGMRPEWGLAMAGPSDETLVSLAHKRGVRFYDLPVPGTPKPHALALAATRLRGILTELRPHIVHCHGVVAAHVARLAVSFDRPPRPPVVYTVHGEAAPGSLLKSLLAAAVEKRMVGMTAAYIAISRAIERMIVSSWGVSQNRVHVIPNGVRKERFASLPERNTARCSLGLKPGIPVIGFIGRLAPEKGPDVLVAAAQGILARMNTCHFILCGDGPLRERLEDRVRRAGMGSWFTFTGFLDDITPVLSAIDLLVLPSRREGFGLAALEAMAAGRPVVAAHTGGLAELVQHGRTGLLTPPGDPVALARAVADLLANEHLRKKMGDEGRHLANSAYGAERMIQGVIRVYEGALRGLAS